MIDRDQQLKNSVMCRVRTIYFVRFITNPAFIEGFFFIAFILTLSLLVSVRDVLGNAGDVYATIQYISYIGGAFMHTRFIVQIITVLAMITGALAVHRFARNIRIARVTRFLRFA